MAAKAILMEVFNAMKNQIPFVAEKLRFALGGLEGMRTRAMECNNLVIPKPSENWMGCVVTKGIRLWNQMPSDRGRDHNIQEECQGILQGPFNMTS